VSTTHSLGKRQVINGLVDVRERIMAAASALSPEQQGEVFLGVWSVKDLLAHLVGWDYANVEAVDAILADRMPAFYAHHDSGWKTFNAELVATYRRDDMDELIRSMRESHGQLVERLQALPDEDFARDRGLRAGRYRVTIARLMRVELSDERKHLEQIQSFARQCEEE
jgi:uncharacterized damage-inducible protein DinB